MDNNIVGVLGLIIVPIVVAIIDAVTENMQDVKKDDTMANDQSERLARVEEKLEEILEKINNV